MKLIIDGKVAVVYSMGFGAGWYSWNKKEDTALLFDSEIVELVMQKCKMENGKKEPKIIEQIRERALQLVPDGYFSESAIARLMVEWVPKSKQFYISEYDGSESVVVRGSEGIHWIRA